jgi:7-cyano-7-deazaguanine synthase
MQGRSRALVIFSGGQDSTTCLYWAKQQFAEVQALTFAYGQRHEVEIECARDIALAASVPHHIADFSGFSALSDNALTNNSIAVTAKSDGSLPNTFVPGRNLMFLTAAAAYAQQQEIRNLVIGAGQVDYSGYPDCREEFMLSAERSLQLALDTTISLHRPLMFLDKAAIWQLGEELGCLEIIRTKTHTCYLGERSDLHPWGYGCGQCPACRLRKAGFETYRSGAA